MGGNISVDQDRARRRRTEWLLQQSQIECGDDDAPEHGGDGCAAPTPACKPLAATPVPHAEKPMNLDRRYSRIADDYHSVDQVALIPDKLYLGMSSFRILIFFSRKLAKLKLCQIYIRRSMKQNSTNPSR